MPEINPNQPSQVPVEHMPVHHTMNFCSPDGTIAAHVDIGGDFLLLPLANGKEVLFEMHKWFGPIPVSKLTGEELRRIPGGFWDAFERWWNCGKLVVGDRCVFEGGESNSSGVVK